LAEESGLGPFAVYLVLEMPGIRFDQVEKRFNEVVAVRDFTLDVPDGELLVILGPTGCGKTTMLRCVAGLERPNAGEIRVGDRYVFSDRAGIDLRRETATSAWSSSTTPSTPT